MAPPWTARYADLTGKAAIVAGDLPDLLVEVVRALAANGTLIAVVSSDRTTVDAATAVADGLEATVFAMAADPASAAVWARVVPHVEQRLGPVDVAVDIGAAVARGALAAAVVPDMALRRRGVVIDVGPDPATTPSERVRRRHIVGGEPASVAAAVLLCASDALPAYTVRVDLEP